MLGSCCKTQLTWLRLWLTLGCYCFQVYWVLILSACTSINPIVHVLGLTQKWLYQCFLYAVQSCYFLKGWDFPAEKTLFLSVPQSWVHIHHLKKLIITHVFHHGIRPHWHPIWHLHQSRTQCHNERIWSFIFSSDVTPAQEIWMDASALSQLVGSVMWGSTSKGANIIGRDALGGSMLAGKEIYSDIVQQVWVYMPLRYILTFVHQAYSVYSF